MSASSHDIKLFTIMKEANLIRVLMIWFSAWSAIILFLKLKFFFNCKLFWIHLQIISCISLTFWLASDWTELLIWICEQDRKCKCKDNWSRKNVIHTNYFNKCKKLVSDDRNCDLFISIETEMIIRHVFVSVFNSSHVI